MITDDNDLLPVLVLNAVACQLGIIDRETFEALSAGIPRPDAPPPPGPPNPTQAVLDMNGAALKARIINPTQHGQYRRAIEFRKAREDAANEAAKKGLRRIVW